MSLQLSKPTDSDVISCDQLQPLSATKSVTSHFTNSHTQITKFKTLGLKKKSMSMSNKKKTFISITISIFPYSDITKFKSTRNIIKLCKKKKNHMKNKPVLISYTYYQVFVMVFTGTVFHPVSPPPFPCVFACGLGGTAAAVTHLCHYHKLWSSPPFSQIVLSSIVSCAFCFFCGYCLTRVQISTISLLNNHLKCLHLFTCDTCLVWKPSENTP